MRKTVGLMAVALVVALPGLSLARGGARTVARPYSPVEVEPNGSSGSVRHSNVVTFKTRSSERSAEITIEDATGSAIPASVEQDVDGDGEADMQVEICGATESPIAIQGGVPVTVSLQHGTCGPVEGGRVGNPTSGEVTAVLAR
ncbi:MAG TPA: hypothetical protein VG318_10070 [Actinomycetota bacterium]|nr:hypothetical protein [Actinomycetota bacterium]